jgi:hypothetical protein
MYRNVIGGKKAGCVVICHESNPEKKWRLNKAFPLYLRRY